MASLPTRITEKQTADLPWLNSNEPEIAARLDVTGHSAEDISKFQSALNESGIVTKLHSTNSTTYVVVESESESILSAIRLKHLPLVDGNGLHVHSYTQFDSNTPLQRVDTLFKDLHPNAEVGARAENPAAMKSLQKLFHSLGYRHNDIVDGKLEVLASPSNAKLFQDVGAIKGPYEFTLKPLVADSGAEPARDGNAKNPAETLSAAETENNYKQFHAKERPSLKTIAESFVNHGRYTPGLVGALIVTADAALAASPALDKGEYNEAAMLALNSTTHLAAEVVAATKCTALVAEATAPLLFEPPIYAAVVTAGAVTCASGTHETMAYGDKVIAYIQERVKEVAADNGLDPEDAWSSLLQKAKEAPAAPIETQQEY